MATKKASGFSTQVRKVTTTIGETGTADREEDTYVLGATIDGAFVPFVTKSAGYIDHLVSVAKATEDTSDDDDATTDGD